MSDKRLKMPVTDAQVVIKYLQDGQPVENILYVQHQHRTTLVGGYGAAAFDANAADWVASKVKEWLQDDWKVNASPLAEATEVDVIWNTVVDTGPLAGKVYQDSDYPIVGTAAGDAVPNNVTIAIEWQTGLLGRSFHGRTYMVGLPSNQLDPATPNLLKASSITGFVAFWDDLRAKLTAAEFSTLGVDDVINDRFPLGVMSFVGGPGSTTAAPIHRDPALFTVIDKATLSDPFLDSQRRRLPGHNRHR